VLRTPRIPLLGAAVCAGLLAITGVLAYLVPVAHVKDSASLQTFRSFDQPDISPVLGNIAHLADPRPYALMGLLLVAIAVARRRWRVALAIVVLLVATGFTTESLKHLLAAPRYTEWLGNGQIQAASWPSGHATASMTLALCAVLAVPARLRPVTAGIGVLFAVGVSYSILALGWHFPTDVVGGVLVAGTWTLLAVAVLLALDARWPTRARVERPSPLAEALAPIALGAGVAAGVVGIAMTRRNLAVQTFAEAHTTFVVVAALIAAMATALAVGLARGLRT
jgi:membrane-associated phospholipid phosphatase